VLQGLEKNAWFLDLNSVSPGTKRELAKAVAAAGGRFVEAAVMSAISPRGMASPILAGGPHAAEFLPLGRFLGFSSLQLCSEAHGRAAATKMCRSVVVKGVEALLAEALLAARHYGVEDEVLASLQDQFPRSDWSGHARYMIARS
jgi:3-hydroxyisobutyrate dehydrogenase-like beta-hydroxyacid dehydrogenase